VGGEGKREGKTEESGWDSNICKWDGKNRSDQKIGIQRVKRETSQKKKRDLVKTEVSLRRGPHAEHKRRKQTKVWVRPRDRRSIKWAGKDSQRPGTGSKKKVGRASRKPIDQRLWKKRKRLRKGWGGN